MKRRAFKAGMSEHNKGGRDRDWYETGMLILGKRQYLVIPVKVLDIARMTQLRFSYSGLGQNCW